jgi:hypothetical protein
MFFHNLTTTKQDFHVYFAENRTMEFIRILLICLCVNALAIKTNAQFSAGLDLAFPVGDFTNMASTGFGVSVRYDAAIKEKLFWTASAGFLSFAGKTYTVNNVSIPFDNTTNIPVSGGVKYYFTEASSGLYGAADLSINFLSTWVYSYNNGNGNGYLLASESETKFGINPGIGYRLTKFDFSARYNAVGDFSHFGLRVAYIFGGK